MEDSSRNCIHLLGAAIAKYHRQGGLNNRNLFPHTFGSPESKIKVSTGLVSPKASFLGLHELPSVSSPDLPAVRTDRQCLCAHISYETTKLDQGLPIGPRLTLFASF